jgi:arylsulfatase
MKAHFAALLIGLAVCSAPSTATSAERPNVLVVMADDLGYSDLGCYGGEIETPHLDRLAAGGLRFTQFYNTAKCHSSRISLLTGCYAIQAGDTKLDRAVTSAEVLARAGYFTAMTGKWHLDGQPTDFGFERYFGHLSGACNYFRGDASFRLHGKPWPVPEQGFYTTVANVDFAIEFLREARQTAKPWYLYVAFNAPHAPLQAIETDYRKYDHRYDQGWDVIRDARIAKQKQLGLIDEQTPPSPRPQHVPAWDNLSPRRRDWESRRMTTLAAMIDRLDQELGRLLADLDKAGELSNTLVWFVSDNGACPYDRRSTGIDSEPISAEVNWSDSTGWAWARNAPFRYYKQNQYEGGIATPSIVHWPAGMKAAAGSLSSQPAHLIDVLPTLANLCAAPIPTRWPGRDPQPISGISLAPVLAGEPLRDRPPIHLLFGNDRGLRDGDWKIVSFRGQPWELYNLAADRTELVDLADQHPDRLARMVERWTEMTTGVLGAPPRVAAPVSTTASPHQHPEWTDFTKDPGANREPGSAAKRAPRPGRAR